MAASVSKKYYETTNKSLTLKLNRSSLLMQILKLYPTYLQVSSLNCFSSGVRRPHDYQIVIFVLLVLRTSRFFYTILEILHENSLRSRTALFGHSCLEKPLSKSPHGIEYYKMFKHGNRRKVLEWKDGMSLQNLDDRQTRLLSIDMIVQK